MSCTLTSITKVFNLWRHITSFLKLRPHYITSRFTWSTCLKMWSVPVVLELNLNVHSSGENRRQRYRKSGYFNDVVTGVSVRPRDTQIEAVTVTGSSHLLIWFMIKCQFFLAVNDSTFAYTGYEFYPLYGSLLTLKGHWQLKQQINLWHQLWFICHS